MYRCMYSTYCIYTAALLLLGVQGERGALGRKRDWWKSLRLEKWGLKLFSSSGELEYSIVKKAIPVAKACVECRYSPRKNRCLQWHYCPPPKKQPTQIIGDAHATCRVFLINGKRANWWGQLECIHTYIHNYSQFCDLKASGSRSLKSASKTVAI